MKNGSRGLRFQPTALTWLLCPARLRPWNGLSGRSTLILASAAFSVFA
jgi:hypothetical protein